MEIILNNRKETFEKQNISIAELLELKKFSFRMLIVKVNGTLIKKDRYHSTYINSGDEVVVLHMISGG